MAKHWLQLPLTCNVTRCSSCPLMITVLRRLSVFTLFAKVVAAFLESRGLLSCRMIASVGACQSCTVQVLEEGQVVCAAVYSQ